MQLRQRSVDEQLVRKLAASLGLRTATARCLVGRGVVEPADAKGFIDPRLAALRPPQGLAGMSRAVGRIADAVTRGQRIGVFGDYDVDGVTTAALLASFLRGVGATVECAVARRDAGYGFTPAAAADFAKRGCELVITGDCGTNDLDAIAAAAALGTEVIVVDHHTVPAATASIDNPAVVHPAVALVNPFRADSTFPFRGMASVGLAFYVAAATRTELRDRGWFTAAAPDVRELLDLVALGTIADLVPLTAENRILTSLGLRRLQSRARPGIAALLDAANVSMDREVDAHCVAWKLAPRLNAPGRLGAAEPSLSLLLADSESAALRAQTLEEANGERRQLQEKVVKEALASIEQRIGSDGDPGPAIVIAGEGWPTGIVGLVASKLVDRYQRPAFVVGIDPVSGLGRGSARTPGNVNLYEALKEASQARGDADAASCLERYGGHAMAAGFTVKRESIAMLSEALGGACARLAQGSGPVSRDRMVDAEVRLAEIDERLATELAELGPFGQHNPAPLLVSRGARVTAVRRVGNDRHLKLTLEDPDMVNAGRSMMRSAIAFNQGARQVEVGMSLDLAFVPSISTYQGRRSAELDVFDFEVVEGLPPPGPPVRVEPAAPIDETPIDKTVRW